MDNFSPLQKQRLTYKPKIINIFKNVKKVVLEKEKMTLKNEEELKKIFPETFSASCVKFKKSDKEQEVRALLVGVVFSGGQASGGHNVIAGLFDCLMQLNPKSRLFGFLNGPLGIIESKYKEITKDLIDKYRNLGGFDLIGSGRTKIETEEQLDQSMQSIKKLNLDGLVIIGGDDSNTNAAILAEYLKKNKVPTKVVGVPKTIDGDLRSGDIEISFGFDTACKVYSELIGNIATDALSAKKYYHFIRLMGRSASHIALECALKTQPNMVFIGEEVLQKKKTLKKITDILVDLIEKRAKNNKNYGIILIPEGLIEFIAEFKVLISELNILLAANSKTEKDISDLKTNKDKIEYIQKLLSKEALACFEMLSENIQSQLLLDRDPHGNVKVSQIETEKILIDTVKKELKNRGSKIKFNALNHFFGYEGRSGMPSNFDATYCYNLGFIASMLIKMDISGYICCLGNLTKGIDNWQAKAIPITSLITIEERHAKKKPVVKKALVELNSNAFKYLEQNREEWSLKDMYLSPGSIQYFGGENITDTAPKQLILNHL